MLISDLKDIGLLLGNPHYTTSKEAIAYVNNHLTRYTCVLIFAPSATTLVIERQWHLSPLSALHTKRLTTPFTLQELEEALLSVRKAPLCP